MKRKIEEQQHPPALVAGEENPPPRPSTADLPPPLQRIRDAVSLNIWPPSQRIRDAVVNRLVEILSSPSVLSKRYGTLPHGEPSAVARRIEEAAFSASSAVADGGAITAPRDDAIAFGIEMLEIYSKEIQMCMMESVKSRVPVAPASSSPGSDLTVEMALQATPVAGEENPPPRPSTADQPPPRQLDGYAISLNIWPPSQCIRNAVVNRLIETLSSPSVLSKRYGTLPHDEPSAAARCIEEEAFSASSAVADGGAIAAPRDDAIAFGIEMLEIYSKEINMRMLESVKSRVPVAPASPSPGSDHTVEMAL